MTQAATLAQLASSGALSADTSGNVGIGTTTPDSLSNFKFIDVGSSGTNQGVVQANNGTVKVAIYANSTEGYLATRTNHNLVFQTNATTRATIDTSGNLNLGTATTTTGARLNVTNGTQQFQVGNSIGPSSVFAGYLNVGGNNGLAIQTSSTAGIGHLGFYNPNGQVGSVVTNGSGTTFNTSSDYRLKENITPMTGALATVAQLKPCTYTWKVDGSEGQGFIAHELQEVVPDAVTGEKDAVNEDGSIKPQGIDTSFLVATLTAALQELKAELDVCKAEIAALKGV